MDMRDHMQEQARYLRFAWESPLTLSTPTLLSLLYTLLQTPRLALDTRLFPRTAVVIAAAAS